MNFVPKPHRHQLIDHRFGVILSTTKKLSMKMRESAKPQNAVFSWQTWRAEVENANSPAFYNARYAKIYDGKLDILDPNKKSRRWR
ncbi:MAG: hypothetical protein APU95_04985 [Hadesarchaea archaeon YNP_N21]|nr:MAG: hypothetical protein APU95_04985 [Hadesarchaea archaeon YNP_N21]